MANLKLRMMEGPDRVVAKDGLKNLVNEVIDNYSFDEVHENALKRKEAEFSVAREYLSRKTMAFTCKDLTKSYGSDFTLGPISLRIRRGDITAVVGENGNGKTTLFRLIAGELIADGGSLSYPICDQTGEHPNWRKVKSSIAYVPQELPVWRAHLGEMLEYEAAIHGIKGRQNKEEVDFVIERLGLRSHLNKKWKHLSGGYKFRFALARALVWRPKFMILDEPLANLDVNAQLAVLRDIKSLALNVNHPIAVFVSSQHLHEIESIADNVLFLSKGQPLFNNRRARLGEDRNANYYELACDHKAHDVEKLLETAIPVSITQDGLNLTLKTPLEYSANDVLNLLTSFGVGVNYFRDISRSSKRIFTQLD